MEHLYDETEKTFVRFLGFISDKSRYDFCIVSTHQFFGKPLVICMQTGRSALLSAEDTGNLDYLTKIYNLSDVSEAEQLSAFLETHLPTLPLMEQY